MCTRATEKRNRKVGKGLERFLGSASRFFSFLLSGLEKHRKWEGAASFFGILALGCFVMF